MMAKVYMCLKCENVQVMPDVCEQCASLFLKMIKEFNKEYEAENFVRNNKKEFFR